jgi:DnaK suppressor protein
MTTTELSTCRRSLKNRLTELGNGGGKREALSIEDSPDELDRIQHAQERDFAIGTLDRGSKLLHEVQAALGRMDADSFGICLECENNISMKRLAAVPWTALCIGCQEVAESTAQESQNENRQSLLDAA